MITISPEQTFKMKFNADLIEWTKAVCFFSIIEDEGEHYFGNLVLYTNGGSMFQQRKTIPLNMPFKIEKGKITYFGEIYINYRKNQYMRNDMREMDLKYLKENFPNLKLEH